MNNALFKLSYGLYVLSTVSGEKKNGCIIDACIQVANDPERVLVSVQNRNFTCDMIRKSGKFTISILDKTVTANTIEHFGYQSGRDVDKFEDIQNPVDKMGVPYLNWQTCAVLSCKVVSSENLGSHTTFIAEIVSSDVISNNEPVTYAYYRERLK